MSVREITVLSCRTPYTRSSVCLVFVCDSITCVSCPYKLEILTMVLRTN